MSVLNNIDKTLENSESEIVSYAKRLFFVVIYRHVPYRYFKDFTDNIGLNWSEQAIGLMLTDFIEDALIKNNFIKLYDTNIDYHYYSYPYSRNSDRKFYYLSRVILAEYEDWKRDTMGDELTNQIHEFNKHMKAYYNEKTYFEL